MKLNRRGFTLIEIMIASVIMVISFGIFLSFYTMGQRLLKGGMSQMRVVRNARNSLEKMSRHIRSAQTIQIFNNYTTPALNNPGSYIQVTSQTTTSTINVGYYLNNQGEIRYIDNLGADNPAIETDDEVIAREVVSTNLFNNDGWGIRINFSVRDTYAKDGYQGIALSTRVQSRNNPIISP